MSTAPKWLRPSILPKLALCGQYRSEAGDSKAAARGTAMDEAFRDELDDSDADEAFPSEARAEAAEQALLDPVQKLLAGTTIDVSGLDEEARDAIRWAVDTAKAYAGTAKLESREERLKIAIFGMDGTADLLCLEHCWSADLKSGQRRNYVEQQAAYALGFMEEMFVDEWTVYIFYCDLREVDRLHFTRESAMAAVRSALAQANSNEPPRVNDYCGWCARRFDCPARRESLGIVPFDGPGAIAFESARSEQLRDFVLRATVVEDFKKKARDLLKERVAKGEKVEGVSMTSRKGSRKIDAAHLMPIAKWHPERLLEAIGSMSEAKAMKAWSGLEGSFPADKVEQLPGSSFVRVSKPKVKALK